MAVVALITSGDRRIYALPGKLADVERVYGGEYGAAEEYDLPSAMRLPTELVQQVYHLLAPADFNAARHTCRSWHFASLDRTLLVKMLKQGGWWSSLLRILSPMNVARAPNLSHERIMSKWISRECNLANVQRSAFVEVGYTDFSALVLGSRPGDLRGAISFTVSLCGRFLMAVHGRLVYIYELNHVCPRRRSMWSVPLRRHQGMPVGFLRPVSIVQCPRRVLSCSMDTTSGRYAAAFLMEGRVGMVCDIMAERTGASSPATSAARSSGGSASGSPSSVASSSSSSNACVCHERSPCQAPPLEEGPRSVYRNICHPDDPPRSVALCPQRNCVAFGCSAGIELHWVDALTGQDLSRWFPLTSPSDYLYFLPPRRGVDTAKKLRLISSAAGLGCPMDLLGNVLHGFSTSLLGTGSTAMVSSMTTGPWHIRHGANSEAVASGQTQDMQLREDFLSQNVPSDSPLRRVAAASADHFRAVPLSDGYHILFTDPRTGNLCLGTDAPVRSLTRLIRKVWFRPPPAASSPVPFLYTAGADTQHGVRVVATFAASRRASFAHEPARYTSMPGAASVNAAVSDTQVVVFYTVPPDVFHDMTRIDSMARPVGRYRMEDREEWQPEQTYGPIDIYSDPFRNSSVYPLEIRGQPLAVCSNLTEVALDSSPELIIWAFSAEGWARTWAIDAGRPEPFTRTAVQRDGGLRRMSPDGDLIMADPLSLDDASPSEMSWLDLNRFDGAPTAGRRGALTVAARRPQSRSQGLELRDSVENTVSIDLVEEVRGITRMDVEIG